METCHGKLVLDLALVYTHQLLVSRHDDFIRNNDEAKEKPCYDIMQYNCKRKSFNEGCPTPLC